MFDLFLSVLIAILVTITLSLSACCYDEINGTQDLMIYSHADSLILFPCLSTFVVVVMGSMEFKTSRSLMLIL